MAELTFKVTIDEANLILEGLGLLQFARVYALVDKIQKQAGEQVGAAGGETSSESAAAAGRNGAGAGANGQ